MYIVSVCFCVSSVANSSRSLTWGYVNFAPYHYDVDGKVQGLIADRVERLFKQVDLHYNAVELPAKRAQLYIEQGKVDFSTVIDSFIPTPEKFFKSDAPVYTIKLGAICLQPNLSISSFSDLKRYPVILISGYTYGTDKTFTRKDGYQITVEAQTHENAIKALIFERGECVLGYYGPFQYENAKYPEQQFHFYQIQQLPVHLFLSKDAPGAESIITTINRIAENL
ncbi:substrate-binding periplasmic protein [Aestuariibacter salexigens]|uniref:substrate-binding periplasmic protein n=1 Tax=Aestuariibacter salexigens TaxID=226010 RepID=UPI00146FAF25|nr:transporter substrate-binding domain-containing protein [Aestuariibacter salexigens]